MNLFDLSNKNVVITGATRGLGQAMAVGLAEHGADILLVQRDTSNTKTKEMIEKIGRKSSIIECDLNDMNLVRNLFEKVDKIIDRVDIVVNNAGIQRRAPAEVFSENDWDDVIDVDLKAVFLICQQAGKRMLERKQGKIINTASLISFQGGITIPAYASAKGGVAQLTKALANEWAGRGINVNAIAPGYIDTDLTKALQENEVRNRQILERIPAERWGQPDDMKGACIFLASKASDYVHGHLLVVDGGWLSR